MKKTIFTVAGEPQGKARPRFVDNRAYKLARTKEYEERVKAAYLEAGGEFLEGPIQVGISAYCLIPKSAPKARTRMMEENAIRPTKVPDVDNIIKGILDSLNGIAYKDDRQVVAVKCEKFYTRDNPRVAVELTGEKWLNG